MTDRESLDCLRLALTPGIGCRRIQSLLAKFKTGSAVCSLGVSEIASLEGFDTATAARIVAAREKVDLRHQLRLLEINRVQLIPVTSSLYPENLRSICDPPPVLFVKGNILPDDSFSIALVGTRLASFYGRTMAETLSRDLASRGLTITSGGALGIDTFAHQAALRAGGRTFAVLGCGLDVPYPAQNRKLFADIARQGALISEFPLGTGPLRQNFPMRNRIISGLSLGIVVVEAPQKSGALITATHAAEQGRQVFSVPGRAGSFSSRGSNRLLRDGACMVEQAGDVLEELAPLLKGKLYQPRPAALKEGPCLNIEESDLYEIISENPVSLTELAQRSALCIRDLSLTLVNLQFKGMVRELPGQQYIRT